MSQSNTTASGEDADGGGCHKARARAYYEAMAESYGCEKADGWFSWVRRREMTAIRELAAPRPGLELLDAGCGPGVTAAALACRGARVTGVDASPKMLERAANWVAETIHANIETLSLGRVFDVVLCAGVLEFVDQALTLTRLAEHVRPGGRLVLLVPVRGIGGFFYRREQARRGIAVTLPSVRELDAHLSPHGLRRRVVRRPFFHSRVLAYDRTG